MNSGFITSRPASPVVKLRRCRNVQDRIFNDLFFKNLLIKQSHTNIIKLHIKTNKIGTYYSRPPDKSAYQNICCCYSKELGRFF